MVCLVLSLHLHPLMRFELLILGLSPSIRPIRYDLFLPTPLRHGVVGTCVPRQYQCAWPSTDPVAARPLFVDVL